MFNKYIREKALKTIKKNGYNETHVPMLNHHISLIKTKVYSVVYTVTLTVLISLYVLYVHLNPITETVIETPKVIRTLPTWINNFEINKSKIKNAKDFIQAFYPNTKIDLSLCYETKKRSVGNIVKNGDDLGFYIGDNSVVTIIDGDLGIMEENNDSLHYVVNEEPNVDMVIKSLPNNTLHNYGERHNIEGLTNIKESILLNYIKILTNLKLPVNKFTINLINELGPNKFYKFIKDKDLDLIENLIPRNKELSINSLKQHWIK